VIFELLIQRIVLEFTQINGFSFFGRIITGTILATSAAVYRFYKTGTCSFPQLPFSACKQRCKKLTDAGVGLDWGRAAQMGAYIMTAAVIFILLTKVSPLGSCCHLSNDPPVPGKNSILGAADDVNPSITSSSALRKTKAIVEPDDVARVRIDGNKTANVSTEKDSSDLTIGPKLPNTTKEARH
jgi:hypothetical protein